MNELVYDFPEASYHAVRALSASGIWDLADINEGCPAKFWLRSPWNTDREPENKPIFDIGTAAHLAVLEPDRLADRIAIIPAETLDKLGGYGTQASRDLRDAAYTEGKTPLKPQEWQLVQALSRAIDADPLVRAAFAGEGESEVTALWDDRDYPVPCKARADRVLEGGRVLVDLKTVASAHPIGFSRAIWDQGHFSRAAFYLDGFEAATGRRPDEYWFVAIEKKPPYLTAVHKLPDAALEWGWHVNRAAVALFAECAARNDWPGYRPPGARGPRAFVTDLPKWASYALHDRFEADEFKPRAISAEDAKRAMEFLAP